MLLTLPLSVVFGSEKFKAEYERCRGYYLHGIADEQLGDANKRLDWLKEEEASIWGGDRRGMFEIAVTIPLSDCFIAGGANGSGPNASRPRSSSVNDVLDSPISPISPAGMEGSTFPSFASSLAPPPGALFPNPNPKRRIALTTEFLVQVNERTLAKCLGIVHGGDVSVLMSLGEGEVLRRMVEGDGTDKRVAVAIDSCWGAEERLHWLTRLVLLSLLDLSE
jgi:hypothetical protein